MMSDAVPTSDQPIPAKREFGWLIPALASPIFLGMAPVLGKLAYAGHSDPFTVAAVRTVLAALFLWITYFLFARRFMYIYPAGLLGCVVVGTVNGIGSLMYYNGLNLLSASVAQLLNATYLIFVVVLARLGGQALTQRTLLRVGLACVAIMLLTGGFNATNNWLGIGLMLGNAILFAGTVILSQRVLYEMPSPTVALYVLTTMAVVVVVARAGYRLEWLPQSGGAAVAIGVLGLTTALSRLTLFAGVKRMGSLQVVLLVILETSVSLLLSFIFLGESFDALQWLGVGVMGLTLLLRRGDDLKSRDTLTLPVVNMAGMRFQVEGEAFVQAFAAPAELTPAPPDSLPPLAESLEPTPEIVIPPTPSEV